MPNISGSSGAQNTNVVTTPTIVNFTTSPTPNTETSYSFPAKTKRFSLKNRGNGMLKIAYASGQSGITYWSLPPATSYEETEINVNTQLTIYLQSTIASQVLEVISWS